MAYTHDIKYIYILLYQYARRSRHSVTPCDARRSDDDLEGPLRCGSAIGASRAPKQTRRRPQCVEVAWGGMGWDSLYATTLVGPRTGVIGASLVPFWLSCVSRPWVGLLHDCYDDCWGRTSGENHRQRHRSKFRNAWNLRYTPTHVPWKWSARPLGFWQVVFHSEPCHPLRPSVDALRGSGRKKKTLDLLF